MLSKSCTSLSRFGSWKHAGASCLLSSFVSLVGSAAFAQREVPGPLFGGDQRADQVKVIETDPFLPRGAAIVFDTRPVPAMSACSVRRPVCVHAQSVASLAEPLKQLESAFDAVVWSLEVPEPQADGALGGGPELDYYLQVSGEQETTPRVLVDSAELTVDRASGFCVSGGAQINAHSAAKCVGEASALGLDAAEAPALRKGYATYLSWLTFGADEASAPEVEAAQNSPHLNITKRDPVGVGGASAAWFAFVDQTLTISSRGKLATALFRVSRGITPRGSYEWHNEPDTFDVVRRAFDNDAQRIADFMIQFGVARAFMGNRDDGKHVPGLAWLGDRGRVSFDWSIKYSSLPRFVASSEALEPMGSSYVWLSLDGVPLGARIAFRAEWEAPVRFKWQVVSVDKEGREMNRWDVAYLERETQVEKLLMNFEGAAGLIFVAMNLGGVDLLHPYDPDYEPWEKHGYTLYLTEMK